MSKAMKPDDFQTRPCCLCGGTDYVVAPHSVRHFSDGGAAAIFICTRCAMTPFFNTYNSRYRELLSDEYYSDGFYTFAGSPRKVKWLKIFLDEIEQYLPLNGRTLLDVGCGEGFLLDAARDRGARVKGIEPAPEVVADLQSRGHAAFAGLLEDYAPEPGETWDVVTMFLVIDATIDPVDALRRSRAMMSPDGVLAILTGSRYRTPFFTPPAHGFAGLVPRILRDPLDAFRPEADWSDYHPYFFTRKTLRALLAHTGFEVVQETPEYIGNTRIFARPASPVPLDELDLDDPLDLARDFERWHSFDRWVRPVYRSLVEKPVIAAARAVGRRGS